MRQAAREQAAAEVKLAKEVQRAKEVSLEPEEREQGGELREAGTELLSRATALKKLNAQAAKVQVCAHADAVC